MGRTISTGSEAALLLSEGEEEEDGSDAVIGSGWEIVDEGNRSGGSSSDRRINNPVITEESNGAESDGYGDGGGGGDGAKKASKKADDAIARAELLEAEAASARAAGENERGSELDKEASALRYEQRRLERYLEVADQWWDAMGAWRVTVQAAGGQAERGTGRQQGTKKQGGGGDPDDCFMIVVQRNYNNDTVSTTTTMTNTTTAMTTTTTAITNNNNNDNNEESNPVSETGEQQQQTSGWVVVRDMREFVRLHARLRLLDRQLPRDLSAAASAASITSSKSKGSGSGGKSSGPWPWSRSKRPTAEEFPGVLEAYLNRALSNLLLQASEPLFVFLNPSTRNATPRSAHQRKRGPWLGLSSLAGGVRDGLNAFADFVASPDSDGGSRRAKAEKKAAAEAAAAAAAAAAQIGGGSGGIDANNSASTTTTSASSSRETAVAGGAEEEEGAPDSLMESLYMLIDEIFELRGVSQFMRRQLVAFVQLSYGGTLNRNVKDSIAWLLHESQLTRLLQASRLALFPDEWNPPESPTPEERLAVQTEARRSLLLVVPDVLVTLLGAGNGRRGIGRLFDALQSTAMNRRLFYTLLEAALTTVFPELERRDLNLVAATVDAREAWSTQSGAGGGGSGGGDGGNAGTTGV